MGINNVIAAVDGHVWFTLSDVEQAVARGFSKQDYKECLDRLTNSSAANREEKLRKYDEILAAWTKNKNTERRERALRQRDMQKMRAGHWSRLAIIKALDLARSIPVLRGFLRNTNFDLGTITENGGELRLLHTKKEDKRKEYKNLPKRLRDAYYAKIQKDYNAAVGRLQALAHKDLHRHIRAFKVHEGVWKGNTTENLNKKLTQLLANKSTALNRIRGYTSDRTPANSNTKAIFEDAIKVQYDNAKRRVLQKVKNNHLGKVQNEYISKHPKYLSDATLNNTVREELDARPRQTLKRIITILSKVSVYAGLGGVFYKTMDLTLLASQIGGVWNKSAAVMHLIALIGGMAMTYITRWRIPKKSLDETKRLVEEMISKLNSARQPDQSNTDLLSTLHKMKVLLHKM